MASYALVSENPVASDSPGGQVLALVVTDGVDTEVYGDTDLAEGLRDDVDWGVGDERAILSAGLTGLSWFTITGPHDFEGDTATAGPVLARSYGLA